MKFEHFKQVSPALTLLLLAVTAFLFDGYVARFDYHKTAILGGEFWRLISGHLFHTNYVHFILNIAGLSLLTALHYRYYHWPEYSALIIVNMCSISALMLLNSPLEHYVGLSGVLHGVFVWGALKDIEHKEKTGVLLFLGIWLKVVHEQLYGASSEVAALINASVAIDAHLYGAITGSLFYLAFFMIKKLVKPSSGEG